MRALALSALCPLVLAACGWSKPAASPENADDSESSDDSSKSSGEQAKSTAESESSLSGGFDNTGISRSGPPPAEKATIKDEPEKKDTPCSGSSIADLLAAISQASCELPTNAPLAKVRPSKDVLEVKASADAKIAPGSTATISVVYVNKGKEPLPLDFTIDPDPRFVFELYTPRGGRVDKPAGGEPSLPPEVADAPAPEPRTARVTLAPNGKATLLLPWQAVKYKWVSKEKAKGALPGRGYPREPAGPLPRGKYVLRVITPLTNTDESSDHELSQARVNVEIAGAPQVAPPPVAAPAPKPEPAKAAAAAAPPSDEAIEKKFLKATGGSASPAATKKR